MKLHHLHKDLKHDINVARHEVKEFLKLWHYHAELELVYIVQGKGTLYAGDYIGDFEENDLFFLGKNIPHMFDSHSDHEDKKKPSIAYVIHANEAFFSNINLTSPEFAFIKNLLRSSERGIRRRDDSNLYLMQILDKMLLHNQNENAISFLWLLMHLDDKDKNVILASNSWQKLYQANDQRLNKVIQYIMSNFQNGISLDDIAALAGMNKTAFCRYFKASTGKSLITFLNELRIHFSCKLLSDTNPTKSISEACYQSGFNSLSYYNRTFKKIMGVSPTAYKRG